ncbi:universal stress protein [Natrinema salsiterrestre]|uniref:universal stress protein n=1 Tax=Natrinema salsiterrestre TaxID=2950540 RepID=UPI003CE44F93
MYEHILLSVDGSDEARRAAKRGLEFARAFGATVDGLHVADSKTPGRHTPSGISSRSSHSVSGTTEIDPVRSIDIHGRPSNDDRILSPSVPDGSFVSSTDTRRAVDVTDDTPSLSDRRLYRGICDRRSFER